MRLATESVRNGQVGLLWLGQSGFALRFPTARVLIDAFLSPHPDRLFRPPFPPELAIGFDLIACTHEHIDHLDVAALPALAEASPDARILVPAPLRQTVVAAGIPESRVIGMRPEHPVEWSGVRVHALPACHGLHVADAYNFGEELSNGAVRYLGYVFQAGGVTVYHSGDTIDYEGLAGQLRAGGVNVALLPINGRNPEREAMDIVGNLDAAEAARLAVAAEVDLVVPMHYDMIATNLGHPEQFVEAVRLQNAALRVVVPARNEEFIYTRSVR